MKNQSDKLLSRRTFAHRAALLSASVGLASTALILPSDAGPAEPAQAPNSSPKLSTEGEAEAEARYQLVLGRYGSGLNEEQKKTVKQICYMAQPSLEKLRSFSLKNGDVPALFFRPLVQPEKPTSLKTPSAPAGGAHKS
jgi:hypothetical protein